MNRDRPQESVLLSTRLMAIEVLSDLLANTHSSELPDKLVEQLRELTGAYTTLLILEPGEDGQPVVMSASPLRRRQLFLAEELTLFRPAGPQGEHTVHFSDLPLNHPWREALDRAGVETFLRLPLLAAGEWVGTLLLVNLPEPKRIGEVTATLVPLLPLIAMALKNALVHLQIERQAQDLESRVAQRTEELQLANQALKLSAEWQQSILQTTLAGFMVVDAKGQVLEANQSYCRMTGYTLEELLQLTVFDLEALHTPEEVRHNLDRILTVGAGSFESLHRRKDASVFDVEVSVTYRDIDGGRYISFIQESTSRQQALRALSRQKERLAVTLQSIGDGVITTDVQGQVTNMNRVAETLCGWKESEATGRALAEVFCIVHEISREPLDNPAAKVLASGQGVELSNHTVLVSRTGGERVITDSASPIRDATGAILGVVLVFRDTTEKQKMMDALQRSEKLDSLGILAGGIAHDFNNLLGGIFGYLSLAKDFGSPTPKMAEYLSKALSVFDRAKALTQQLLTFSKGGAPDRRTGALAPLISATASFALSGSNIIWESSLASDLWTCAFDENQIGQVLDNLMINARQAMPSGGTLHLGAENVVLSVNQVSTLAPGRYVKITVTDNGPGIAPHLIKFIFDPFFTTKEQGNGLGLAISSSILHKHDGFLDVESVLGEGTRFLLYLPASTSNVLREASSLALFPQGEGTILILEDEDFLAEILGQMLLSMGYQVLEARSGEEVENLLPSSPVLKAAILDLTIRGGKGGLEIVPVLKARWPEILVFASSGFSNDPVMANPGEFGFDGCLHKPFQMADVGLLLG